MASRKETLGALGALLRRIATSDSLADLRGGTVLDNARRVYESASSGDIRPLLWTAFRKAGTYAPTAQQLAETMALLSTDRAGAEAHWAAMLAEEEVWINSVYSVSLRRFAEAGVHLSIKRIDQEVIHDWRDLQRIKNELVGAECEAVELYPAVSRMVDTANQYHLWVITDPTYRFPFGFDDGRHVHDAADGRSSNQRKL